MIDNKCIEIRRYVLAISRKEGCMYIETQDKNCFFNNEIEITSHQMKKESGEAIVKFRDEQDFDFKDQHVLDIKTEYSYIDKTYKITFSFLLSESSRKGLNNPVVEVRLNDNMQSISIWPLIGTKIGIKLVVTQDGKKSKIVIYNYFEKVIEEININELSIRLIIAKVYEMMLGSSFSNISKKFKMMLRISKPAMALIIKELVKNWIYIITKPVKDTNDRIKEIDDKIAELMNERKKELDYLSLISDDMDDLFTNIDSDYNRDNRK